MTRSIQSGGPFAAGAEEDLAQMKLSFLRVAGLALIAMLVLPSVALAAGGPTPLEETQQSLNTMWVIVAGVLVMFMQAGFLFLEIGFSRAKNAGAGSRRS